MVLRRWVPLLFAGAAFTASIAGAPLYRAEQGACLVAVCAHDGAVRRDVPTFSFSSPEVSAPIVTPYTAKSCASNEVIA